VVSRITGHSVFLSCFFIFSAVDFMQIYKSILTTASIISVAQAGTQWSELEKTVAEFLASNKDHIDTGGKVERVKKHRGLDPRVVATLEDFARLNPEKDYRAACAYVQRVEGSTAIFQREQVRKWWTDHV
jgi:hypothetical protein